MRPKGFIWLELWKCEGIENIMIFLLFVGLEWKSRSKEKVSLYKLTHIPLIKNDAQKVTSKKRKRKRNHPNLLKNKNHVLKIKIISS